MFSLIKKKATASKIGIALLQIPSQDLSSLLEKWDIDAEHQQHVKDELLYLLAFLVDYATSMSLGKNSPETKAILNVYYLNLREMAKKGEYNAIFYENLYYNRLPTYTNAINTPHQNGVAYTVGVAFAKLCGVYPDIKLTMLGSSLFAEHFKSTSEFLKSWRIIV